MIQKEESDVQIRRLQTLTNNRSYFVTIPKTFVDKLKFSKGDFLKCSTDNGRLVIEKTRF